MTPARCAGERTAGITGGIACATFLVRARRAIAVLAVRRHLGARHAVALSDLTGNSGSRPRWLRDAHGHYWGEVHDAFPFRLDEAAGQPPSLS